jgi:outer membrane protein OmpA-like peptidoglycan-associated protein
MKRYVFSIIAILLCNVATATANPNQYGATGLLTVPSAETLDAGNICVGVWGNACGTQAGTVGVMPVALTLGIGSFWEIYGSYPNVLFNGDESAAGRGTVDLGTKLRIWGKRSSKFKLGADVFFNRHLSENRQLNGQTDIGGRLIASLRGDLIGAHFYGGYVSNSDFPERRNATEYPFGFGLEYDPSSRSKITIEVTGKDAVSLSAPAEAAVGFQYYISPHLTFNISVGVGLTGSSPDWRSIVGLSTCQGVGSYIKPIPKVGKAEDPSKKKELIKPTKIIPLSPLLVRTPPSSPTVSKYEVPLDPDREEIVIRPYGQIILPQQPAATPVVLPRNIILDQPEEAPEPPAEEAVPGPVLQESPIDKENKALEYTLTRVGGVTPTYGIGVTREAKEKIVKPQERDFTPSETAEPSYQPQERKKTTVTVYRKFRLPDTIFEFGSSELSSDVKKGLTDLGELIRKDTKWSYIRIDGHTDGIGSVKYNLDLSLKRAIAVANYLITREGIDPARIFVKGIGKSTPIADNQTEEGRKINRRFDILFLIETTRE